MTILDQIIADKRIEVAQKKSTVSFNQLKYLKPLERNCYSLKEKLNARPGIIAEFKRQSPSKGIIKANADVVEITKSYEMAGASACSILTDQKYFNGQDQDIVLVRPLINIPILRKEFIIDPFQIIEAKVIGADLILLIAECLTKDEIKEYTTLAHDLGMEVLMELHFDDELDKWNDQIDLIGVNNRNLKTFETGIERSMALVNKLPKESIWISESGLKGKEELTALTEVGYKGFLIGETFMKGDNPGILCQEFIEALNL